MVGCSGYLVIYLKYVRARFLLHVCWFVTSVLGFAFFVAAAGLFAGMVGVVEICEYFKPLLSNLDEFK